MPARVVVALSDAIVCDETADALSQAGYGALPLPSSLAALGALESARRELLIVRAACGPGELDGIALAQMARAKRPDIKVLLIGERRLAHHMEGLGAFLVAPADAPQIVRKAIEMLGLPFGVTAPSPMTGDPPDEAGPTKRAMIPVPANGA
jgi:DNA-binding NtrC family response regulator